ncbi:MAG: hypothetical protein ACREEV_17325, partial [Dongiaceae bacterium]
EFRYKLRVPAGEAEFSEATFGPVTDALAERPRAVGELLDLVSSRTDRGMPAGEIIVTLLGSKQAVPLREGAGTVDQAAADRLNRILLDRIEEFDPNSEVGLAVAALGTGVKCNFSEALILRAALLGADDLVEHAVSESMRVINSRGERVLAADGKAVETEREAVDIVRNRVRQVTADKIAVWQRLLPDLKSPGRSAAT